ncbi:MAG: hypothetical protein IKJ25_04270 [Clostridia bacterium]|nr:hypothetical protein [Clostridia bacterium]
MTQATNNYDKLYENMKQRFTISQDDNNYTIGEYMLMKANSQKADSAALPVAVKTAVTRSEVAMTNIVSFVDDKLTIKQAPVKDKTIKAFPFRASASAFLTASVACAFILSFALIGVKALSTPAPSANEVEIPETSEVTMADVDVAK